MGRQLDENEQGRIFQQVAVDSGADGNFFVMVVLSCTVATYGLLSNSTAVVIGAMLIAPLMGPILGGALALAGNERQLFWAAVKAEAMGGLLAVVLATVLTLVLPRTEVTPEILARTNPTIVDLIIALASGAAGTYAICYKPQSAALPGVAIATALMPPLCTVGVGLARQDVSIAGGAMLLFLANMIAIHVAAVATFELAGVFERKDGTRLYGTGKTQRSRFFYPVLLLVLISVPLAIIMYKTYAQAHTENVIKTSLHEVLDSIAPESTLLSSEYKDEEKKVRIQAAFRTTKIISPENIRFMENLLELRLGKPVGISADIVLVQKVTDSGSVDVFQELLPKIKEKETVEILRSVTPEEIIEKVVGEKLTLFPGAAMDDYSFSYQKGSGSYLVWVRVKGMESVDEKLIQSVQTLLEEKLKRRVTLQFEIPKTQPASVDKEKTEKNDNKKP